VQLQVGEGLLRETFATFTRCGAGRRECVAYWTGPQEDPQMVDEVLHPVHQARPDFYEIDQAWLHRAFRELARDGRAIRAQVHTHGGLAFHSRTDDAFPVVQTAGFLSLVIPGFATRGVSLDGAYLARLGRDGRFTSVEPAEQLLAAA